MRRPQMGDILPGRGSEMSRKTTDIDTPGKHGRVSRRHARQSAPAMPMHRSIRMALPDRPVQRDAASKNDPGSRSAPPARGWPAIGRYQPGDQCRTSSGRVALPADSRGPGHGVRPPAPCPPGHLRSSSAPLVTIVIAISQRTRFPAAPGHRLQARLAREHRRAPAVDVGATECPDLGGSNHGTEGSGWAPDRRVGARASRWSPRCRRSLSSRYRSGIGRPDLHSYASQPRRAMPASAAMRYAHNRLHESMMGVRHGRRGWRDRQPVQPATVRRRLHAQ